MTAPDRVAVVSSAVDYAEIEARVLGTTNPDLYARVLRATMGKRAFFMWAYGGRVPLNFRAQGTVTGRFRK